MANTDGFIAAPRDRFQKLIIEGGLTDEQFLLYEFLLCQADWDPAHIGKFGTIEGTNEDLSELLGWSETKFGRHRKELVERKYLIPEGKRQRVVNFEQYIFSEVFKRFKHKKFSEAILHDEDSISHVKKADLQKKEAELHPTNSEEADPQDPNPESKPPISDIVSSKINYKVDSEVKSVVERSVQETSEAYDHQKYLDSKYGPEAICFCGSGKRFQECCQIDIETSLREATPVYEK